MIKNRGCLIEVEIIIGNSIVDLTNKLNHKYKIRHFIDCLSNVTYSIYFYLFVKNMLFCLIYLNNYFYLNLIHKLIINNTNIE